MKEIRQSYHIKAPVTKVWQALTEGPTAEQWGAAPAKVNAVEGGEFSYWDGDIHGVFTKLVPNKRIEQDWYGHDNPTWKYNVAFTFEGDDKSTTVHMTYSGDIVDEQKDIKDWREYYFTPIKELLESKMNYLRQAVDLSRKSFEAGEFPAGAVLVTKAGNVYESDPSLPHYHGECMVIDKAIKTEGYPLKDAVMYGSMESCLMCSAKMYWAGITEVHYIIPKEKTNTLYAYEDSRPMSEHIGTFNTPLRSFQDDSLLDEAFGLYEAWVKKIEAK